MNRTVIKLCFLCLLLSGCNTETPVESSTQTPQKKIWIYVQFNVPEEDNEIESYWYYGRVNEAIYKELSANKRQEGFIELTQVHYWSNDAVHPYEDEEYGGEMLFRIEDIRKVTRVKRLPGIPEQHERDVQQVEEDSP